MEKERNSTPETSISIASAAKNSRVLQYIPLCSLFLFRPFFSHTLTCRVFINSIKIYIIYIQKTSLLSLIRYI